MAEIHLRYYVQEIDDLIDEGEQLEMAIAHCRHILFGRKNGETIRLPEIPEEEVGCGIRHPIAGLSTGSGVEICDSLKHRVKAGAIRIIYLHVRQYYEYHVGYFSWVNALRNTHIEDPLETLVEISRPTPVIIALDLVHLLDETCHSREINPSWVRAKGHDPVPKGRVSKL